MARARPILNNYTAGELSPRLDARTDLPAYYHGFRTIENFIVQKTGGVMRRSGSKYIEATKNEATERAVLIPFEGTLGNYILEVGVGYIRVYTEGARVGGGTPYEVTGATPPWTEAQLLEIKYAQDKNTMFLYHPSHPVQKLETTADNSWTLTAKSTAGSSPFTAGVNDEDFDAVDHYPRCGTFFEQRHVMSGTNIDPNGIWGSKAPTNSPFATLYENFTIGSTAADAWEHFPVELKSHKIMWLVPKDDILFGSHRGEWRLTGNGDLIDPTTGVAARNQSPYGSANLMGVKVGDGILFVGQDNKTIRRMTYDYNAQSWFAQDLTLFAEHITGEGIIQTALQTSPETVLWCLRWDGTLCALTYEKEYDVLAWHRHIFSGTNAQVESVAIIRSELEKFAGEDEIWVIVKRTINGATHRYIEQIQPRNWRGRGALFTIATTRQELAWYVDSGCWNTNNDDTAAISGITNANPGVVTATGHPFNDGDFIQISGVLGMTEVNTTNKNQAYTVQNKTANTFELYAADGTTPINTSTWGTYTSGGTVTEVFKTISSGLSHLEGETVQVFADGNIHTSKTVSSGSITLDYYVQDAIAGLGYVSRLQPMKLNAGGTKGSSRGLKKKISQMCLSFHESLSCKIGPDAETQDPITFPEDENGEVPLFSGDLPENAFPGDIEYDGNIYLTVDEPAPCTILALIPDVDAEDQ